MLVIRNNNEKKIIEIKRFRKHSKASEMYADVVFFYENEVEWKGSVPIHYRRTGLEANTEEEIIKVLKSAYSSMRPSLEDSWLKEQEKFWNASNKAVTRSFFEGLKDCKWKCVGCDLPENPNWARRVQDIKEMGYTLATDIKKYCVKCKQNKTHLIMLRLPKGGDVGLGYETLSPKLKNRILKILKYHDVYEDRQSRSYALLPDHKFPEIRWDDDVKEINPDNMTEEEIIKKFQLLTNQRNQQKREACRTCFQTGNRGTPFGISFYHEGDSKWPENLPKRGKEAEKGCKGCGWYDLKKWRNRLNRKLGD